MDCNKVFQGIYSGEGWTKEGDGSGAGSEINFTENLRKILVKFMVDNGINEILDAPCGSCKWTKYFIEDAKKVITNFTYQGVDVSEIALERAKKNLNDTNINLSHLDISKDKLPPCSGVILCRDTLQHLSPSVINNVIRNLARTDASWIIIGGFATGVNKEIPLGHFFYFNITAEPYSLEPDFIIKENHPRVKNELPKYLFVFSTVNLRLQLAEKIRVFTDPELPNFWREYLQTFIEYDPKSIQVKDEDKMMVIVETRCNDILESVLKNFLCLLQPKGWQLMIFHGIENENYIKDITKEWNVILHNLNVYDFSLLDYNKLLISIDFWNSIPAENILIFQPDTLLLNDKIDEFMKYDYCGAPWDPKLPFMSDKSVGNGGLSLRKKSIMIACINNFQPMYVGEYEDIFFSRHIINKPIPEIANMFSIESITHNSDIIPVGLHKTYKYINHEIIKKWMLNIGRKWDWEVYLAKNRDLLEARFFSPLALRHHYDTFGVKERRITYSEKPRILFISHCYIAGTYTFYKNFELLVNDKFVVLYYSKREQLRLCDLSKVKFIHINSIANNGICDIDSNFLINFLERAKKFNIKIYMTIHDLQFIFREAGQTMESLNKSDMDIQHYSTLKTLLNSFVDICIFPSKYLANIYIDKISKHDSKILSIMSKKIRISPNPDYEVIPSNLHIPDVDSSINVGYVGLFTPGKGSDYFSMLIEMTSYKGRKINYILMGDSTVHVNPKIVNLGHYEDASLLDILYKNKISLLVYLVTVGESYGFCFSRGITSGIPLLYHNVGSFVERTKEDFQDRYFPVEYPGKNLFPQYIKALDFIISNSGKSNVDINREVPITLPEVYESIYYNPVTSTKEEIKEVEEEIVEIEEIKVKHDKYSILYNFATRNRPDKFFLVIDEIYRLSKRKDFIILVKCDDDDILMNNEVIKSKLESYDNLITIWGKSNNKIHAINRDINELTKPWDILVNMSDDMVPVQEGFDEVIVKDMNIQYPDLDGVLHYNDGHLGGVLMTLSIMGKKYYDRFNYVYHPDYCSFFCDNEAMEVAKYLNKYIYINNFIIEHRHPQHGCPNENDILYMQNNKYWDIDHITFNKRKDKGYDIIV